MYLCCLNKWGAVLLTSFMYVGSLRKGLMFLNMTYPSFSVKLCILISVIPSIMFCPELSV